MSADAFTDRSSRAAWFVRAVLVLSVWNAPLPWVHCHSATVDDSPTALELEQHLHDFHSRRSRRETEWFGWHVHFAFLWQMAGEDGCPDRDHSRPDRHPVVQIDTAPALAVPSVCNAPGVWTVAPVSSDSGAAQTACTDFSPRGHFLETYFCALPVRDLLGVSRC